MTEVASALPNGFGALAGLWGWPGGEADWASWGLWGLWGLFFFALASATVLPGSSELALAAWVLAYPAQAWQGMGVATLGNVLGSVITFAMGHGARAGVRRLQRQPAQASAPAAPSGLPVVWSQRLQRWGPPALFFAFLPVVGDALVLAAGWWRLPPLPCLLWTTLGKAARYGLIVGPMLGLMR